MTIYCRSANTVCLVWQVIATVLLRFATYDMLFKKLPIYFAVYGILLEKWRYGLLYMTCYCNFTITFCYIWHVISKVQIPFSVYDMLLQQYSYVFCTLHVITKVQIRFASMTCYCNGTVTFCSIWHVIETEQWYGYQH